MFGTIQYMIYGAVLGFVFGAGNGGCLRATEDGDGCVTWRSGEWGVAMERNQYRISDIEYQISDIFFLHYSHPLSLLSRCQTRHLPASILLPHVRHPVIQPGKPPLPELYLLGTYPVSAPVLRARDRSVGVPEFQLIVAPIQLVARRWPALRRRYGAQLVLQRSGIEIGV